MDTQIRIISHDDGEIQRTQIVRPGSWAELEHLYPEFTEDVFPRFCNIYQRYLIPSCPWIFGNILLFYIPEDMVIPFPCDDVANPLTAVAAVFRRDIKIIGSRTFFRTKQTKIFYQALQERGCTQIVKGKLPFTQIIPVERAAGFLSGTEPNAQMKVNSSFFIMDPFDCATVYDHIGIRIGLGVKNGVVENPPLYCREALLVKYDGSVSITSLDIRDLPIRIGAQTFIHGENATVYTRPERAKTPAGKGIRLVIIGSKVAAVASSGSVPIPASGFVLCPHTDCHASPGDSVRYAGMENVLFGIQAGNSIIRDGKATNTFLSQFYNIRALERIPFPPSLYPMNFHKSRAARIALGADADGKPILVWAEGAAKLGHVPGQDSCGATLADMAHICAEAGMVNGINLDGGGSAQLLLRGKRTLHISDRDPENFSDVERPVPAGLMIR